LGGKKFPLHGARGKKKAEDVKKAVKRERKAKALFLGSKSRRNVFNDRFVYWEGSRYN